ncbi:hypothetical protein GGQ54_003341 [Naumannella cuiyingiana]|uniref:Uncharacterized protein n=1 Tax=Naumannella cuiyingiana TaxID=1347891 RepID=A0A7Z0IMM1_9ACTN|nr:hypothetical protein [Naumannella cuiyingiana]NYI72727.1 hypothetical protein [Naumannella cuiyingiana]
MRIAATLVAQLAERRVRAQENAAREEQRESAAAAEQHRRALDGDRRNAVEAGRSVYKNVRDSPHLWEGPDRMVKIRVGEALAVSQALREDDPLAGMANQYLRREIAERHGGRAEEWEVAAIAAYRDAVQEIEDRDAARAEAETEAGREVDAEDRATAAADRGDRGAAEAAEQEAATAGERKDQAHDQAHVSDGNAAADVDRVEHAAAGEAADRPAENSTGPGRTDIEGRRAVTTARQSHPEPADQQVSTAQRTRGRRNAGQARARGSERVHDRGRGR